jgi:hypothetical protein
VVKKVWVLIALVAGVVLGSFLTTCGAYLLGFSSREADDWPDEQIAMQRAGETAPVAAPVVAGPDFRGVPGPAATTAATAAQALPVVQAGQTMQPAAATPQAFSATIENAPGPGFRDSVAEMHETLERESRDDSWAYLREAELENTLIAETSVGNFRKERIECRATLCEMELSAADAMQAAALQKWYDAVNGARPFPGSGPLHMRLSSFSKEGDATRVRIFYEKPPPIPAPAANP